MKTTLLVSVLALSLVAPAAARAQVARENSAAWSGFAGEPNDAVADARESARNVKYAGMALTVVGVTLGVVAVGLGVASTRSDSGSGSDEGQMMLGIGGMAAGGIGGTLLLTGGLMWGLGAAKEDRLTTNPRAAAKPTIGFALAPLNDGHRVDGGAVSLAIHF